MSWSRLVTDFTVAGRCDRELGRGQASYLNRSSLGTVKRSNLLATWMSSIVRECYIGDMISSISFPFLSPSPESSSFLESSLNERVKGRVCDNVCECRIRYSTQIAPRSPGRHYRQALTRPDGLTACILNSHTALNHTPCSTTSPPRRMPEFTPPHCPPRMLACELS